MTIGSAADLAAMTRVGRCVALALREMTAAARPGMSTAELDEVGAAFLRLRGARSAPQVVYDFPGFNCISVNEEIVHGIPGPRLLEPGDVVKIDVTAELDGYIADAARTVLLAPARSEAIELRACARSAFTLALGAARAGNAIAEIGRAVEGEVRRRGFSVLGDLSGHGVGRTIHEKPQIPNFYSPITRGRLTEGLVLAIEPIISARRARVVEESDGWTLRTHNRSLAAHYENTVMIRHGEPLVLTAA